MELKFAINLKRLRLESGLSQIDLANKLKTTQRKISYWEMGKTEPDLKSLIDIACFFDISVDFLIGKSEL